MSDKAPFDILVEKRNQEAEDRVSWILQGRCGQWTIVELTQKRRFRVFDIAWGRDIGDAFDHITTNISPGPREPHSVDFFFTSDVVEVSDEVTGEVLFSHASKA